MMARKVNPEQLSEQELRRLLLDKRRGSRKDRLDHFRRTGRALNLVPDLPAEADQEWRSQPGSQPEQKPVAESPLRSRRRRWTDRILLGVEVLAIVGLAGVLVNGLGLLRTLNQEVVAAWKLATPEATPLITAVVLPSGHLAPKAAQENQQNWSEIPDYLQGLAISYENLPIPTAGPEAAINLQIPAIKVDARIVPGDNWDQLRKGVGQHLGTPNPGEPGNLVLAGHNDIYEQVFKDLDKLKAGDKVIVMTISHQYVYIVSGTQIVKPTQVDVMAQTSDATLTLISCYPYMVDNKRIVVKATLQNP